ncbi:AMP-binding protein [Hoeflea alexandrii]|uniref:AMP-binding protein n=1 Tax=Hoeflea alexandrii TaxID=288436 RepID=UPI0022B03761|nr:AMP-binding protein [Hoeflea alexandrii]MCZ4291551.1 AMP-binding protein [Hoeflea alexandrii]
MTDERELTKLLSENGELVTERLDHWAAVSGEQVFFHYGENDLTLSYAEFARQTDAIAGNLIRIGIRKGDRVSVFCRNMLTSTLAMFGIWKAGALYCPVNFAYSGRLLAYQLNDTAPHLIIADQQMVPALNGVAAEVPGEPKVVIYRPQSGDHDFAEQIEGLDSRLTGLNWTELLADAPAPGIRLSFDDPANLIYTSGTTGPAKGVVQPHRWMAQYTFGPRMLLTQDDVIYNDLPMHHVGGAIANVCRAAWVGCEVAVWDRFSPDGFWSRIAARKATSAILLDVMIPWLSKAPARGDDRHNTLNKVHMQPLALQHHDFATRFGIDIVTAGFGQTESGLGLWAVIEETDESGGTPATLYRGHSRAELRDIAARFGMPVLPGASVTRKGLMGTPTSFVEVTVRDEHDAECPPETVGHLTLRPRLPGTFLQAYLGKPEATATAFRNLWFHTGDAVLKGADGMFYYVDRLGDRIRVRGENLSSFQVEDMINQHPQVQMSAAVAIPGREGDEDDVVVFIVAVENADLSEDAVHDFARRTMPKYMRPAHIRIVADLPRTPTNKVEKYKLRQLVLEEDG